MKIISAIKTIIKNPKIVLENIVRCPFPGHFISDKKAISFLYKLRFKRKINLSDPQTFNEKLLWLTLYDRRIIYNKMVDKYEAKNYIRDVLENNGLSTDCIIPTLGVFNSFDEIDFSTLPNSFVLKTTHDSGGVIVVKDKNNFDIKEARSKIMKRLKKNYYWFSREWAYKNVKPRIIVEEYLDFGTVVPDDYKVFSFNGDSKFMFYATDRSTIVKFSFFDSNWCLLNVKNGHENSTLIPNKPKCWDKVIRYANVLSKGFPIVRVDFYINNDRFYIGELTLTHFSGLVKFDPDEFDYKFGEYIDLKII